MAIDDANGYGSHSFETSNKQQFMTAAFKLGLGQGPYDVQSGYWKHVPYGCLVRHPHDGW